MPRRLPGFTFLEAAAVVLAEAKGPLSAREIVEKARQRCILHSSGRTPINTLYGSIRRDIAVKGERSHFRIASRGKFVIANLAPRPELRPNPLRGQIGG
jgi:hypothetical protein